MRLLINNEDCLFTPLEVFRREHQLPDEFDINFFVRKDYTNLGRLEKATAGAALNQLRSAVMAAVPATPPANGWQTVVPALKLVFEATLHEINDQIGLRLAEIEFASAKFADFLEQFAYAHLRYRLTGQEKPDFYSSYGAWINDSVELLFADYVYTHAGANWRIQLVSHVYGRIGFIVDSGDAIHYVYDPRLACPAEGFMTNLLRDITTRILAMEASGK
jgi:hypothetical protein